MFLKDEINKLLQNGIMNIYIHGQQSNGKTNLAKNVLEENKYKVQFYNNIIIDDNIFHNIKFENKNIFLNNKSLQKKALIFPNIVNYNIKHLENITNIVLKNMLNPSFVCIIISYDDCFFQEIVRNFMQLKKKKKLKVDQNIEKLEFKLTKSEIYNMCIDISKKEYNININENEIEWILLKVDFEVQEFIKIMNYLQSIEFDNKQNNIQHVLDFIQINYIDDNIKSNIMYIMKKEHINFSNLYNIYTKNKVLIPFLLHENILNVIQQIDDNYINIIHYLSKSDFIESNIYNEQNWFLNKIHFFYSIFLSKYYMNLIKKKKKEICDIQFSIELNKTSLKNINKKNINFLNNYLDMQNIDLFKLNNFFWKLLHEKKYTVINEFFEKNNLSDNKEKKKNFRLYLQN